MRRLPIVAAACTLALAGCGGDGSNESATTPRGAAPSPARTLDRLIRAASRGDSAVISALVTRETGTTSAELGEGLGTFAGHRARTLYRAGDWAVAWVRGERTVEGVHEDGAYAAALRRTGGRWRVDLSGGVQIRILGPDPGEDVEPIPQVAMEMSARSPLAESGLWVDGVPLDARGGGSETRTTIYGAPAAALEPGPHVAVGFARTARTGAAVAWTFTV